jgi:hypothetical protein
MNKKKNQKKPGDYMKNQQNSTEQYPHSLHKLTGIGKKAGVIVTYVFKSKGMYPHFLSKELESL